MKFQIVQEYYDPAENCIVKPIPANMTLWDKIIIDRGDITVKELLDIFPSIHHGVKLDNLFIEDGNGDSIFVWSTIPVDANQKRAAAENPSKKVTEVEYFFFFF